MRIIDADKLCMYLADIQLTYSGSNMVLCDLIDEIVEAIDEMPTIEQPTWISCKERLPKPEENPVLAIFFNTVNPAWCHGNFWELPSGIMTENVTHWMPLPQPPKGDE